MIIPGSVQKIIIRRFVQGLEDSSSKNHSDLSEILAFEQSYIKDIEDESIGGRNA